MVIRVRDRGIMKWASAAFLPEQRKLLREATKDELRQPKPIVDIYELEEFDHRINEAMEYNLPVVISKWHDGFTYKEKGRVHYVDPIRKEIRMVTEDDVHIRIALAEIIGVEVVKGAVFENNKTVSVERKLYRTIGENCVGE